MKLYTRVNQAQTQASSLSIPTYIKPGKPFQNSFFIRIRNSRTCENSTDPLGLETVNKHEAAHDFPWMRPESRIPEDVKTVQSLWDWKH